MYFTRTTKYPVRISRAILIAFLSVGLSACANPTNSSGVTDDMPSPTNVPKETSQAFRFGVPVESEANALIAAQAGLRRTFEYAGPLTVVEVKQMSYGEYSKQIEQLLNQPADLKVWLVIYFNDEWQTKPPATGVTPFPPFRGCVFVAINAADGSPVEAGGPLQAGVMTECDK